MKSEPTQVRGGGVVCCSLTPTFLRWRKRSLSKAKPAFLGGPHSPHPFFPLPPSLPPLSLSVRLPPFFAFIHHHAAAAAVTHSVIKTSLLRRRSPIFHASDESMPLSPPFCLVPLQKVECLAIGLGTPQSFSFLFFANSFSLPRRTNFLLLLEAFIRFFFAITRRT